MPDAAALAALHAGTAGPAGPASPEASGSAVSGPIARGLPSGPKVRGMRESLGDEVISDAPAGLRPGYTPAGARIGRNDVCYCGSGLKYKKCHGR
jgi:preprotein translocase subunit SecA